ncbi:EAL domain-containing protein [Microbaculum marinisediminis]|uniref:EAL domain-containing protein n=1 Tax=Microbaculum marinisediminis TaxID=2931392 RepID=A0AAW5R0W1_9HYPH|nr:EAL domain-containing protein [Microbaculum sp. A6E488]MCT8972244.1 EAL domain-containing protein [Microbaculum sp. A6E488]
MEQTSISEADGYRLGAVLDSLFSFIGIFAVDGTFLEVNRRPLDLAGLRREDAIGKRIWDSFWLSHSPDQQDVLRAAFRRAAKGDTVRLDLTIRADADQIVAIDGTLVPLLDESGQVTAIIGSAADVSDRETILKQLEQEKDFAENLVEMAPVIVLVLDKDGKITHANPHFEQLTGYSIAEIHGKDWFTTFLPERERERVERVFRQALSGRPSRGNTNAILTRDGREIEVEWHDQAIRDETGRPVSLLAVGQDVSERLAAQAAMAASEARLKEAQRIAGLGNWELDLRTGALHWSEEIFRLFELDASVFTPSYEAFLDVVHEDDRALVDAAYNRSLTDRMPYEVIHRLRMPDGRIKYVHERGVTDFSDDGTPLRSAGTVLDITEQRLAENALKEAERRSADLVAELKTTVATMARRDRERVLLNQMLEMLMSCVRGEDALDVVHAFSKRIFRGRYGAISIHGDPGSGELRGVRWWGRDTLDVDMRAALADSSHAACPANEATAPSGFHERCRGCNPKNLVCVPLVCDGDTFGALVVEPSPGDRDDGPRSVGARNDGARNDEARNDRELAVAVAEALSLALSNVEMRRRLERESTKDPLTQVYNRRFFLDTVAEAMAQNAKDGTRFAVHVLDLDDFKAVNDRFGHPCGDTLIEMVAQRLTATIRSGDTVARLGGDEFAILERLGSGLRDDAASLAKRILRQVGQPFHLSGHQVRVGASIGIALAPEHGVDADVLLRSADLALYKVKSEGRRGFRFFESEMDEEVRSRRAFEADLMAALSRGELELHYQPIVAASTREPVSFEALVRWNHPGAGLLSPDRFIPIAEDTGLIVPIGRWILRKACSDAMSWPAHIKVAVNISPVQFRTGDIVDVVASALRETGLEPGRLELEITESVLLQKYDWDFSLLHRLRDLGVAVVLDDFGTGYSSLGYLKEFRFSKIKIDRSFVAEVSGAGDSGAIVCAVAGLARTMGIDTTAEGIETEEQLQLLRVAGCTQMQGYLFAKPRPVGALDFKTTGIRRRHRATA